MAKYCVTVTGGSFDVEADDEDDAREQALAMVELDIQEEEADDDEEGDDEADGDEGGEVVEG